MPMDCSTQSRQHGAVAIITALSLVALVGFAGLALDLGRLYVNKTELQNAADACALAAASKLSCDPAAGACPASILQTAEAAGIFVGARNNKDFQGDAVTIAAADVRFSTALSPNSNYQPRGAADPNSKFAMCIARATGIAPWFMGVLGIGQQAVSAYAVATLAPGKTFCGALPIGICKKPGTPSPDFGYTVGEWIGSTFNSGANSDENLDGNFRWVDFSISAGGNSEIRDQLAGNGAVCGLRVGDDIRQPGTQQGAKSAYNTRFGIYPGGGENAYKPQDAPPDPTGYAYPNKAPGSPVIDVGTSAYADYVGRRSSNTPFRENEYAPAGAAGNIPGQPLSSGEHKTYGVDRRLAGVPMVDCDAGNQVKILGMACVLMLNPMSNGATGTIYLEYRGAGNADDSPCQSGGSPGSSTATGPNVPTLVQ